MSKLTWTYTMTDFNRRSFYITKLKVYPLLLLRMPIMLRKHHSWPRVDVFTFQVYHRMQMSSVAMYFTRSRILMTAHDYAKRALHPMATRIKSGSTSRLTPRHVRLLEFVLYFQYAPCTSGTSVKLTSRVHFYSLAKV